MNGVLLQQVQKDLLVLLVETVLNTPVNDRQKFMVIQLYDGDILKHKYLLDEETKVYAGDIEILANCGLILASSPSKGMITFDVSPSGLEYYYSLKSEISETTQRVQESLDNYLNAESFQRKYPLSFAKWAHAEELLRDTDSHKQVSLIGHACRESVQEFAEDLIKNLKLDASTAPKDKTVKRLILVLESQDNKTGSSEKSFLEALVTYWGTVIDLIQRQEHGAAREGEQLMWEDARRVVFHTGIVMFEIDKVVSRRKPN